jgi:nucleotide-binding universal stress UspA family protein
MFEFVLVPLDGSALAECVLPHVVAFARAFASKCILVQVLENPSSEDEAYPVDPLGWRIKKAQATSYLEAKAASLRDLDLTAETIVLEGAPAVRICEFARERAIGLIIMSTHGKSGISPWNVSSVVQKTAQLARTSILMVRAYEPEAAALTGLHYRKVLLPLDGSRRAETALSPITTLVEFHKAELLLVHAVERPELPSRAPLSDEDRGLLEGLVDRKQETAGQYLEELRLQLGVAFDPRVVICEDIPASLHELVKDEHVDLLAITAHGRSADTARPYGSLTLNLIDYSAVPLLVIQDLTPEEMVPTEAELAARETTGH